VSIEINFNLNEEVNYCNIAFFSTHGAFTLK